MKYLLLVVSIFSGAAKSLVTKQLKTKEKNYVHLFIDNAVAFLMATLLILCLALFMGPNAFNNIPVGFAVIYAISTLFAQVFLLLATGSGSVSISSLFYSCGFIIPTFFGVIRYAEKITFLHVLAVVLILVSCCLGVEREEANKKFNFKWLFFAIGGFVFSGILGVLQKVFQNEYVGASLNGFLIVAFFIIFLISVAIGLLMALRLKKSGVNFIEEKSEESKKIFSARMLFAILLGVSLAVISPLNTYLSGILPSALFFPCGNGGSIIVTTIGSAVIFKEKLSARKIAGIALCVVAIILIGIASL